MDKRQLQTFSVWAKENLEQQIEVSLKSLGINSASDIKAARRTGEVTVIDGDPNSYPADLLGKRDSIIQQVQAKGYRHIIEEFAYTWFNRLVALRFMEVHNYLPHGFRVLSSTTGSVEPDILRNLSLVKDDLRLDMALCAKLKEQNNIEGLFRYVLVKQCAALSEILPMLFGIKLDYMELILPQSLLIGDTVLTRLIAIPEENFLDDVQIVGWLYQYYNTEPKNRVFANLKKNIKISKHDIPAATQIFTPDWIVHYMVENSLGRLWMEGHTSARKYLPTHNTDGSVRVESSKWNYYLEEAEQEPEVQAQLAEIRKQYAAIKPEEILAIDPCAGSGHILCVLFDVLVNIYEDYGYTAREAVVSIVQNNLWGLDIDDRATQLAYFAVMMKARQYDRRFFSKGVQPHVYAIQESNGISREHLNYLGHSLSGIERNNAVNQMNALLDEFIDAKEYGSILQPKEYDWALLSRFVEDTTPMQQMSFGESGLDDTQAILRAMIAQGQVLVQKYHVVVTNPPYMGASGMADKLAVFVKNNYPDTKSDMSTVCMERCLAMCNMLGFMSMINIPVWMFLSSYEKLRFTILKNNTYINMVHPGRGIFGSDFGSTSFVISRKHIDKYTATYCKLFSRQSEVESVDEREKSFLRGVGRYSAQQEDYLQIPGAPVAYWTSDALLNCFASGQTIGSEYKTITGSSTSDNDQFLRLWYEVNVQKIGMFIKSDYSGYGYKWIKCNKGGAFRRWYGNQEFVIDWENDGKKLKEFCTYKNHGKHWSRFLKSLDCFYRYGITWSKVTIGEFSARYMPEGFIMESAACAILPEESDIKVLLGLMNSKIASAVLRIKNPTVNMQTGDIIAIPIIKPNENRDSINSLVAHCIEISKTDWDFFETSWDFQCHPLVFDLRLKAEYADSQWASDRLQKCSSLSWLYEKWSAECESRFQQLKANEEELNRIFISIYGLQDELTPNVDDKDVTVRQADSQRDIRSLISYLVGIVMGRYSIDIPGLAYAGGDWDASKYRTYQPDDDGIVPIYRGIGMDDGLTARLIKLIKRIYGEETYRANMEFIAEALGKKSNESAEETLNRYLNDGFYADHLKIYQKRPIYWLFTSGKNGGFKCLIYMHRYNQDTLARINGKYFLPESTRLKHDLEDIEQRVSVAEGSERVRLEKERQRLMACYQEALAYGQVLDHMANKYIAIDLDDGVKVNYAKFQGVEMVTDGGSKVKMDLLAPLK